MAQLGDRQRLGARQDREHTVRLKLEEVRLKQELRASLGEFTRRTKLKDYFHI